MFSIYSYLFNARIRQFDLDGVVKNFTDFGDEVVISTLAAQEDDTLDRLLKYEDALEGRLKVVVVDMDIEKNNRFDGDLKTAAMQACTHPVRVIADADERFVLKQRHRWDDLARRLLDSPHLDGWLIPVVEPYGHLDYIRDDQSLGVKFRLHKTTVVRRGVPSFAEKGQGLFNTAESDSTEPLRVDGSLASFLCPYDRSLLHPSICRLLEKECYVVHYGFVNLERRAELGRTFWAKHWRNRSGHDENVATRVQDLMGVNLVKHHLPLT